LPQCLTVRGAQLLPLLHNSWTAVILGGSKPPPRKHSRQSRLLPHRGKRQLSFGLHGIGIRPRGQVSADEG